MRINRLSTARGHSISSGASHGRLMCQHLSDATLGAHDLKNNIGRVLQSWQPENFVAALADKTGAS
jgi:hypothetical protein